MEYFRYDRLVPILSQQATRTMKYCPVCEGLTKVTNTRIAIRMRVCHRCNYHFYTKEIIVDRHEYNKAAIKEDIRRARLRQKGV